MEHANIWSQLNDVLCQVFLPAYWSMVVNSNRTPCVNSGGFAMLEVSYDFHSLDFFTAFFRLQSIPCICSSFCDFHLLVFRLSILPLDQVYSFVVFYTMSYIEPLRPTTCSQGIGLLLELDLHSGLWMVREIVSKYSHCWQNGLMSYLVRATSVPFITIIGEIRANTSVLWFAFPSHRNVELR